MEQQPEPHKHGWTNSILIGISVLLAVALLVVPGYIAGWYCRLTNDTDALITVYLGNFPGKQSRGLHIFLAPARLAVKIAPPLRNIYREQFLSASSSMLPEPPP